MVCNEINRHSEHKCTSKTPGEEDNYHSLMGLPKLIESPSKFSKDNTRAALSIPIEVKNRQGEPVELFFVVTYSWSKKGHMVKTLEKLESIPNPGEQIALTDLEGMQVEIAVENVKKDNQVYSNVVNLKRVKTN